MRSNVRETHEAGELRPADVVSMRAGSTRPKVSIVTACRNCAEYLPECLDSVRGQTMTEWELFLLDDGSTDGTRDVIRRYSQTDARVKPHYFDDNRGPYVRRNFAIQQSSSDFIVIQDADDIMSPFKLEVLYGKIRQDDRLMAVGSFYRDFLDRFAGLHHMDWVDLPLEHDEIAAKFADWQHAMSHMSAIFRKSSFLTVGLYDENPFASDRFQFAKLGEYAKHNRNVRFANVPEYLTLRRVHSSNQTQVLPCFDPRNRRMRYHRYCECKLRKIRQKVREQPGIDIAAELRNCRCGDFLEGFKRHIVRWESDPLDSRVIPDLLKNAVWLFNRTYYVSCVSMLNGIEVMAPDIALRFKNFDLMRAMSLYDIQLREQGRTYLNQEIEHHSGVAAAKFLSDFFETESECDIQNWCADQAGLCDLQMVEARDSLVESPLAYTTVAETGNIMFRGEVV